MNQAYPSESAGRAMTAHVPVAAPEATIADLEKMLLKRAKEFESIQYVYLKNRSGRLMGVISIKELFQQQKSLPVAQFMATDLVTVRPHADQERVVHLALAHNLKAVPVVDKNGAFLGAVLSDTLLQTLYREVSEDMLRLAGIKRSEAMFDNVLKIPLTRSLEHRLPWLLLGLLGGLLAAVIISRFEHTLAQNLVLAAFIPLMVYMADAVGTQMEAFIIRDLAVNPGLNFLTYLLRHFLVTVLIGCITTALLVIISWFLYGNLKIGLVLGLSLFFAITSSVLTGLCVPYMFGRLRLDPANASGPVATIIQDLLSVTIFFLVASWLL
jgi:magnesium transporter